MYACVDSSQEEEYRVSHGFSDTELISCLGPVAQINAHY